MVFEKLLADPAVIGCMLKKFLVIALDAEISGDLLTDMPATAAILSADSDDRTGSIAHMFLLLLIYINNYTVFYRICKYSFMIFYFLLLFTLSIHGPAASGWV